MELASLLAFVPPEMLRDIDRVIVSLLWERDEEMVLGLGGVKSKSHDGCVALSLLYLLGIKIDFRVLRPIG